MVILCFVLYVLYIESTGTNSLIMAIWDSAHVGPYIQFLHFSFGVGAMISPFIVGIMLSAFPSGTSSILWSYWILAFFSMLSAIPTLFVPSPNLQKMKTSNSNELESSRSCRDLITVLRENSVVILVGSYLFLYVGAETSYGVVIL